MDGPIARVVLVAGSLALAFSCSSHPRHYASAGTAGSAGTGAPDAGGAGGGGDDTTGAGGGGKSSAGEAGSQDVSGAAGQDDGTPGAFHSLDLLAGAIGGPGHLDGVGTTARVENTMLLALNSQSALLIGNADPVNQVPLRMLDLSSNTVSTTTLATGALGLTADGAGGLFYAAADHVIRRVTSAGVVSIVAGTVGSPGSDNGTGSVARFNFTSRVGLAIDGFGNLFIGDSGNYTIRQLDIASGLVTTVAGSPGNAGSTDGTKSGAKFAAPVALAFDGVGLYVADRDNYTLRYVQPTDGTVTTVAGAAGQFGSTNGAGTDARFGSLEGLAINLGSIYIGDGPTVRRMDRSGSSHTISTLAGSADNPGNTDGPLPKATFSAVHGLLIDGAGNLLIADATSIREIGPLLTDVKTLAGKNLQVGHTDGFAADARFDQPAGVTGDSDGNVFVADARNETIREISAAGQVSTLAGSVGLMGHADATGPDASFALLDRGAYPSAALVVDGKGNLVVTDTLNQNVRSIEISSRIVSTIAGAPRMPSGIARDGENYFVAEKQTNLISKLSFSSGSWSVTTLAGGGSGDGVGTAAGFALQCSGGVAGIASDGHGMLFVADCQSNTIRQIDETTREVTTLAGSQKESGKTDGIGAAARFNQPYGIAADRKGNLYIADFGNAAIRKLSIATKEVTTLVGAPGQRFVQLGALPASLAGPNGVVVLPDGRLVISDIGENAILVVH